MQQQKIVNVFGSAIIENKADCPDCHGSGEVWTWNNEYEGMTPKYCKCGIQIGDVDELPLEINDDDRETIQLGDYHYYNGVR